MSDFIDLCQDAMRASSVMRRGRFTLCTRSVLAKAPFLNAEGQRICGRGTAASEDQGCLVFGWGGPHFAARSRPADEHPLE